MFFYIGGTLAGLAIGYAIAITQKRGCTTYKKGVNDCRNCKYLEHITECGVVSCKKICVVSGVPEYCTKYRCTEDTEGDS